MLTIAHDSDHTMQAAMEWHLVDDKGQPALDGRYVYVDQLHANPHRHGVRLIATLIGKVAVLAPCAVGAYWERRDKTTKQLHGYTRERLLKAADRILGGAHVAVS